MVMKENSKLPKLQDRSFIIKSILISYPGHSHLHEFLNSLSFEGRKSLNCLYRGYFLRGLFLKKGKKKKSTSVSQCSKNFTEKVKTKTFPLFFFLFFFRSKSPLSPSVHQIPPDFHCGGCWWCEVITRYRKKERS